ncbi:MULTISPECIES: 4Fe-4S binding protein [unclassified Desulfovibrio]|uniref:4Fe-4S binding protein n=1 Tax=unclassified Desulfovibrio TaxID=2593640 RepID=UPI000F5E21AB|nr:MULTISPECIES: 4Fe-4S binding protein [unclassified Desulfovibrio]RRD69671.1 4Fe-4S dicluster domain-containing protein [Desulfovibrio sp. OH1209_COT-279]RRD86318.1 4Fe-4S dicluster domain-containing protein [Desulfovibrio sp. OH1186_COT-070]
MYMLPNVLRNLSGKPATRLYPLEEREPFPLYRGVFFNDVEKCIFCNSCARVCPTDAIVVDAKAGIWKYDPFSCVYCSACVEKCPTKCLIQGPVHRRASVTKFVVKRAGTPRAKKSAKAGADAAPATPKKASKD